jgi:hypothetical protein
VLNIVNKKKQSKKSPFEKEEKQNCHGRVGGSLCLAAFFLLVNELELMGTILFF